MERHESKNIYSEGTAAGKIPAKGTPIRKSIRMKAGKTRIVIAVLALISVFMWSCEETSGGRSAKKAPESYLTLKQDPVVTSDGRYVFEIQNFVSADIKVYQGGDVPNDKLRALWDSSVVRWGFRRKDNPKKIYWVQKNKAYTAEDGNTYTIEVEESEKAKFIPTELPAALLQTDLNNLEIYAMVSFETSEVSGVYKIPDDFKTKVMEVTEISGRISNLSSKTGSQRSKVIPGASVYYIHKETGKIFQSYSDIGGNYRIALQHYGRFSQVVVTKNMSPYTASYDLQKVSGRTAVAGANLEIRELTGGQSFTSNLLYDITSGGLGTPSVGGTQIKGSTLDVNGAKTLAGAYLLFYNKGSSSVYFALSGADGGFGFRLPDPAPITTGDPGSSHKPMISFVPSVYGYVAANAYVVLGDASTYPSVFNLVSFDPDPTIELSDRDRDSLPAEEDPDDGNWDTDGDGIPDGADVDVNGDGTPDNGTDSDGDKINDVSDAGSGDADADNDGIKDERDKIDNNKDDDRDNLPDDIDPNNKNRDTDGDNIPDGADVDVNDDGKNDNGIDTDGDGINDRADVDADGNGSADPGKTDGDGDGITDAEDPINDKQDTDKDGLPDAVDPDSRNRDTDGDGIPDGADVDVNGDGVPDNGSDTDGDGINDRSDIDSNPGKTDTDGDGIPDDVDPVNDKLDTDKDGLPDAIDPNPTEADTDGDGIPDGSDVDVDGDGKPDNGKDTDGDGTNDKNDPVNNSNDADRDGLPDDKDPNDHNPDTDGDGIPDGSDVDVDGDGTPDNGKDTDGDGINDKADVDSNPGKPDKDNDGITDIYDAVDDTKDADKDGLPDALDSNDKNRDTDGDGIPDGADVDVDGDGTPDNGKDTDGDGINDRSDKDSNPGKQDTDGDGTPDDVDPVNDKLDTDKDGLPDAIDPDSTKADTDGDGIPDGQDVDVDGDGTPDNGKDSDGDGINDANDPIDNRNDKDKDGLPDHLDPNDDNPDTDGDGIPDGADVDVDGDGTPDNGTDADKDGINDKSDVDSNPGKPDKDNDGITDVYDVADDTVDADKDGLPAALDPNDNNPDTDGDGIPDGVDVDVDGDGTPDNGKDSDGDGINDRGDKDANTGKPDADNDGIPDSIDKVNNNIDTDLDSLPDAIDPQPLNWDSDDDGIPDGADVDINGDGTKDNGADADNDGINNRADVNSNSGKPDTDGDGIIDEVDKVDNNADADKDELPDAVDPDDTKTDTDNDKIKDGHDVDVNGDNTIDNGVDADNNGVRDGALSALEPQLSWDNAASTATQDANRGKFDFDGSTAVVVTLSVKADAILDKVFTYEWYKGTPGNLGTLDRNNSTATALFALTDSGANVITVKVSNARGQATLSRTYELNKPPYGLTILSPTSNQQIKISSGTPFPLTASATDDDANQTLSYSWQIGLGDSLALNSTAFKPLTLNANGTYVFTQSTDLYTMKVRVTDGDGGSAEKTVVVLLDGDASGISSSTRPTIAAGTGTTQAAPMNNPLRGDGNFGSSTQVTVSNVITENGGIGIRSVRWLIGSSAQTGTAPFTAGRLSYSETFTITNPLVPAVITMIAVNDLGEEGRRSETFNLNQAPAFDESVTGNTLPAYDIQTPQSLNVKGVDVNGGVLSYAVAIASGSNQSPASPSFRELTASRKTGQAGALTALSLDFNTGLSAGNYTLRVSLSDSHGSSGKGLMLRNITLTGASTSVAATAPEISWASGTSGFSAGTDVALAESTKADPAKALVFVAPTGSGQITGNSATVAISIRDRRASTKNSGYSYQWALNGTNVSSTANGLSDSKTFALRLGLNTITMKVTNDDGQASAQGVRKYYVNKLPENLRITAPIGSTTVQKSGSSSKTVTFSASAVDVNNLTNNNEDPLSYTWKVYAKQSNGSYSTTPYDSVVRTGASYSIDFSSVAANDYQVVVSAKDSHNGVASLVGAGSDRVAVTVNANPVVTFTKPTLSEVVAGVDVSFQVSVSDSNVASPNLDNDFTYDWKYQTPAGSTWNSLPTGSTANNYKSVLKTSGFSTTTGSAVYKIRVTVRDKNGGSTDKEFGLGIKLNTVPNLQFLGTTSVSDNQKIQLADLNAATPPQNFYVSATDPDGQTITYSWEVNGLDQSNTGTGAANKKLENKVFYSPMKSSTKTQAQLASELSGLSAAAKATRILGRHKVIVTASAGDGQGSDTESRNLLLNVAPVVSSVTATADDVSLGDTITFTANATDAEGDELTYSWKQRKVGTAAWTAITGTGSTATLTVASNWTPGSYQVAVTVDDGYGGLANTEAAPKVITVIAPSPTVAWTSATPAADSIVQLPAAGGSALFGVTVSDVSTATTALDYTWKIDGTTNAAASGVNKPTADLTLPSGRHYNTWFTVSVTVKNSSGRETTLSRRIQVNNAPSVSISSPANGSVLGQNTEIALLWSYRDSNADGVNGKAREYQIASGHGQRISGIAATGGFTTLGSALVYNTSAQLTQAHPPGDYTIRLFVEDNRGAVGAAYSDVTIKVGLAAPTVTLIGQGGVSGIRASWGSIANAVNGYEVSWGTGTDASGTLATVSGTSYDIPSLTAGTTYYVKVRALSTNPANTYAASSFSSPQSRLAGSASAPQIKLTESRMWVNGAAGIKYYRIGIEGRDIDNEVITLRTRRQEPNGSWTGWTDQALDANNRITMTFTSPIADHIIVEMELSDGARTASLILYSYDGYQYSVTDDYPNLAPEAILVSYEGAITYGGGREYLVVYFDVRDPEGEAVTVTYTVGTSDVVSNARLEGSGAHGSSRYRINSSAFGRGSNPTAEITIRDASGGELKLSVDKAGGAPNWPRSFYQ
ncbi:hypothetical protein P0082_02170 [Candidatus Haliotispira prima]|uniref:PKD/Chitinase domain-containing protein n=1 Tax=Candidatus Haliotispira prima TaxID=3034016 RepID=A0ABY8MI39_9SPIO|nr:hypothetical protein P0082_02170 [Candidatus Haliotispira prima]